MILAWESYPQHIKPWLWLKEFPSAETCTSKPSHLAPC